jgi:thioredoxin 1
MQRTAAEGYWRALGRLDSWNAPDWNLHGGSLMADLSKLTDSNFRGTLSNEGKIVAVDFWAAWCPPCRVLSRVLESLAEELVETHRIYELDVDLNPVTAAAYGVRSLPTVVLFAEGKEIGRIVGALPKEAFRQRMESIVASPVSGGRPAA